MRTRLLAALAASTALLLSVTANSATATPFGTGHPTAGTGTGAEHVRVRAEHTLAQAKALFTPKSDLFARQMTAAPSTHDATMVLRNLRLRMDDLSPADRRTAHQILARPTDAVDDGAGHAYTVPEATPVCNDTPSFCVHYVTSGSDRVPAADVDGNGVPDQVDTTVATMKKVWSTEVDQMGYHQPLDDSTSPNPTTDPSSNPNGGLDIYLEDLGNNNLYGYCTSDDPDLQARQVSAYCVLDNDYAASQYGKTPTPQQDLEVTLAHEFFHAVQFSYDIGEDRFFMEGTAAWMEDEVYPSINDNLQYLPQSPLAYPMIPLDFYQDGTTASDTYLPYGSWIWWKFLSEWVKPGKSAVDPTIIRDIWTKAKGSTYSVQALKRVLATRHKNLTDAFTTFEVWNRNPARFYRDGKLYPAARLGLKRTLTKARPGTATIAAPLAHLAGGTARFTPGTSLAGAWRLRIHLNMPDLVRGSAAAVTVHRRDGSQYTRFVKLNRSGDASPTAVFGRGKVKYVELTLVNASTRYTCHRGFVYACNGKALDGGLNNPLRTLFSVKAVR